MTRLVANVKYKKELWKESGERSDTWKFPGTCIRLNCDFPWQKNPSPQEDVVMRGNISQDCWHFRLPVISVNAPMSFLPNILRVLDLRDSFSSQQNKWRLVWGNSSENCLCAVWWYITYISIPTPPTSPEIHEAESWSQWKAH